MQRYLKPILQLAVCFAFALGVLAKAEDAKIDLNGTWKWSFTNQNGQARETTLKVKQDGDKVTGTISGRNGDTAIDEAKLTGADISFSVTREFNGNKMTQKYQGKISADTIKGKIEALNKNATTNRCRKK